MSMRQKSKEQDDKNCRKLRHPSRSNENNMETSFIIKKNKIVYKGEF